MRVVELNRNLFRQFVPISIVALKAADDIRHRTGDQKILLHKAQTLPLGRRIVRIQQARDRFRLKTFTQGTHEIACSKLLKIEVIRGCRRPESKSVDRLASVAHHGTIKRYADQRRWASRNGLEITASQVEGAVYFDFNFLVGTCNLPGIVVAQPIVGTFLLPAIHDGLLEHAIFITQTIARGWKLHGGHGIKETCSEASQPAVPKTRVGLLFD